MLLYHHTSTYTYFHLHIISHYTYKNTSFFLLTLISLHMHIRILNHISNHAMSTSIYASRHDSAIYKNHIFWHTLFIKVTFNYQYIYFIELLWNHVLKISLNTNLSLINSLITLPLSSLFPYSQISLFPFSSFLVFPSHFLPFFTSYETHLRNHNNTSILASI